MEKGCLRQGGDCFHDHSEEDCPPLPSGALSTGGLLPQDDRSQYMTSSCNIPRKTAPPPPR